MYKFAKSLTAFCLLLTLFFVSLPGAGYAQVGTAPAASARSYEKQLATIEEKVEARRKELGIPGMSLAIVKDDQVIVAKGLGYKDFEKKAPVTADTQFAIGSATKAFTALSVLMSQDEGKLSLDDSPKKLLPYFKMYDPETDKAITIRDLLSHSSGLNRTDLAMITGKLNRAELIQVAAQAKPTAKLREKFQYQNIMYTAAGEAAAVAQKMPWEKFVPERIFKPLGMSNSTMFIKDMEKAKDFSYGYDYNFDTKETTKRPFREIAQVAPAGSINSSARDMAEWIRFVLNGGVGNGKRLVSETGYAEWIKPQMKMNPSGTQNYGLGWFLRKVGGYNVVEHGGNIDGFNSLVAMVPDKKIGFVMLTNVSNSSLGNDIMSMIFSTLLDEPKNEAVKLPLPTLQLLAGKYGTPERSVEIKIEGEDLFIVVPGQPPYKLERTAPRTFKALGLPDGFGAKFTPETGDATELEMIQPQGNRKLPRLGTDPKGEVKGGSSTSVPKELVGKYTPPGSNNAVIEIKEADGKITLNIPGQPAYTLSPKPDGSFALSPLPEAYFLNVKRDGSKVISFTVTQPEGAFEFKRAEASADAKPAITVAELRDKAVNAVGGEAAIRKITSRVTEADIDMVHQGVQGKVTSWAKAPNKSATDTTITALGKTIASAYENFDGTTGQEAYTFGPAEKYEGKRLDDMRLASDLYLSLDWVKPYKKVEITGIAKVDGEDCYVVSFEPNAGTPFKEYYSTTTFLQRKREGVVPSSTSSLQLPYTIVFSDYREVDGIKIPFKSVNNTISNGDVISIVKSVKHNVAVDDKVFTPRKLK
jgi:CubicO group peptidase (beta-lactamase class C family)